MVKNLPANAGDMALIPGSGRALGEGNGSPLQYSCLGRIRTYIYIYTYIHTYIHMYIYTAAAAAAAAAAASLQSCPTL